MPREHAHAHGDEHDHEAHGHEGHDHAAHDHAEHDHAQEPEDTRLRVLHGASPVCHWSYGYEPVLQRLRLVYGEQIKVNTYTIPIYESWAQWKQDYEMEDPAALRGWMKEIQQAIRLPISMKTFEQPLETTVPITMVLHAAESVKPGSGERFARLISFAYCAEGADLNDEGKLLQLAEKSGAPRKQVEAALSDGRAAASLATDVQSYRALGLNFYALQLRDFEGRTVLLDQCFDSAKAEDALDWLGRGKLRKQSLPTPAEYAAQHAPVSLREVQEVFRLDEAKARKALETAEKSGKVRRKELEGHTFWLAP